MARKRKRPGGAKKAITSKQKSARRKNIAVARAAKSKGAHKKRQNEGLLSMGYKRFPGETPRAHGSRMRRMVKSGVKKGESIARMSRMTGYSRGKVKKIIAG